MSNRIVYTAPGANTPSGGLRLIYHHVELLVNSGYDAIVWEPAEHTPSTWFKNTVPVIHGDTLDLDDSDVLIMPEGFVAEGIDPAPGCRKVIYNQGHFLTFRTATIKNYPIWDPTPSMWVSSQASFQVTNRLLSALPIEQIKIIPHAIDTNLFQPTGERQRKVVWMPRKRRDEASILHALFTTDKRFDDTVIKELDGLTHQQTATEIGSSSVLIALGYREGFGLPIAEALSCGCSVVGYPAGGGAELFLATGTYSVQESDVITIIEKVAELLEDPPTEEERNTYRAWIKKHYPPETQRAALIAAVDEELAKPARPGRATHPFLTVKHLLKS